MHRYSATDIIKRYHANTKFFDIMEQLPPVSKKGPWLCGGAIRRTLTGNDIISDLDFFFANEDQYDTFCKKLKDDNAAELVRETDFNRTFKAHADDKEYEVQAIRHQWFDSIDEVLESFDFTITMTGYDGTDIVVGDYTLFDLGRKRLQVNEVTYGTSTIRRIVKYAKQGYWACPGAITDILERVIANPETVNPNIVSID